MASSGLAVSNFSFVGLSNLTLTRNSDGLVMNFPKPMSFVLADNTANREQMTRTDSGKMARINTYSISQNSELTISYSSVQPELIAFQLNKSMEPVTGLEVNLPRTVLVPSNSEVPGAILNTQLGYGIVADEPSKGSYTEQFATQMSQEPYATWNTWKSQTTPAFAIGEHGALRFTDNLAREQVTLSIPWTIDAAKMTETLLGDFEITATLVDSLNKVHFVRIPSAQVNTSGVSIDASAENFEFRFFVYTPPGRCTPYDLIQTKYTVAC